MEMVYLLILIKVGFIIAMILFYIIDDIDSLIISFVGFLLLLLINAIFYYKLLSEPEKESSIYKTVNVDSVYHQGYKRGQIDCQNDSIIWKKVMNNDGEIIYQKTQ